MLAAPVAWLLTIVLIASRTHREINELYDTDMVRLAQQLYVVLSSFPDQGLPINKPPIEPNGDMGYASLRNVAVSAWRPDGKRMLADAFGNQLPINVGVQGFIDQRVNGHKWRLYYLQDPDMEGIRVVVGHRLDEREEMIHAYMLGQTVPWFVGFVVLVGILLFSIRQAVRPVLQISKRIAQRDPDDPNPLDVSKSPGEIQPLLEAINQLLGKTVDAIERERRLTADAAHELRTPLAALRAQWDAGRNTQDSGEKRQIERNLESGFERMDHLITQLLDLARLEKAGDLAVRKPINWADVMREALSDCLSLSARIGSDIEVKWPDAATEVLPLKGDPHLMTLLLRNLMDNALRYSPSGSTVVVEFFEDRFEVRNPGAGVPEDQLVRLTDRFYRGENEHKHTGTGLGLSIVGRIASAHDLALTLANITENGAITGFCVTLSSAPKKPDQAA